MTSLLARPSSRVNQSDLVIIDKQLTVSSDDAASGAGGGSGGGGGGGGGGSNTVSDNGTSPSPAIWFLYNSTSTSTIENSNASRHFADHPETSGAVGIEAIIIVAVVSLIPVSVIACMVFVISFNCLKKRNTLWSTTASPNTAENNSMAKKRRRSQTAADNDRHGSTICSIIQNENVADDAYSFNSENGRCSRIAMIDAHTPLSFVYPADAFSTHLDASKTTPISSNSVITMTMRNNHLIVETEERVPCCSLLDVQNFYVCDRGGDRGGGVGVGGAGAVVIDGYASRPRPIQEFELDDDDDEDDDDGGGDGVFDETDSLCENRWYQHTTSATCIGDEKCELCDDADDVHVYGIDRAAFHSKPLSSPPSFSSTVLATYNANRKVEQEDDDQHVQIFHKNLPVIAKDLSQQQQQLETLETNYDENRDKDNDSDDSSSVMDNDVKTNAVVADTSRVNTGYSQCDATASSSSTWRRAQNDYAYAYGNQSEYITCVEFHPGNNRLAYTSYGCDQTPK